MANVSSGSKIGSAEELGNGLLVIISGPSGVGKGTVIAALKKDFSQFVFPLSHTTRAMRPGEKDGEVYHFITREDFERGIDAGEFLEIAKVHQSNYYGTLKQPIVDALRAGKIVVREVDVQGFHSIRKVIPATNLVTIFLKAESTEKLMERIARRGQLPAEELARRMESARRELADADQFDFQVWSLEGQVQKCVEAVEKIIQERAEKVGLKI